MANAYYTKFKQALLAADIDMETDTIRAQLVDTGGYAYSGAHQFLSSVPAAARIGDPVTLSAKTIADGVFDAADTVFAAVPAGTGSASAIEALVIYKEGTSAAASPLIGYVDEVVDEQGNPIPMSITPNGADITVRWPANGIFAL